MLETSTIAAAHPNPTLCNCFIVLLLIEYNLVDEAQQGKFKRGDLSFGRK
jgi:hypothetical protein